MLGIQENILDFEVLPVNNPKYLALIDLSDYMENPKNPNIRITLPGYNKPIFLPFKKDSINKYTSNHLQPKKDTLELFDLPDGLYKISYHIYPHEEIYVEKYYLRTSILMNRYKQFLLSLEDSDCSLKNDQEIIKSLTQVKLLIDTANANVEESNNKIAGQFYRNSVLLLDRLTKKLQNCN